jgi:hypothetical protein
LAILGEGEVPVPVRISLPVEEDDVVLLEGLKRPSGEVIAPRLTILEVRLAKPDIIFSMLARALLSSI